MKNKLLIIILCLGTSAILFQSCVYRTGEENPEPSPCGNPDPVSYTTNVFPILDSKCIVCHTTGANPGGGIILDTYAGLKSTVDNGSLSGAINHENGFSAMPRNQPKLEDCTLELIESWIDDGAPEN